jgi:2OG-Fe(II) oxygenase superfamily
MGSAVHQKLSRLLGLSTPLPPVFTPDGLERLACHEGYSQAQPFPHLMLDGLFDPGLLRAVVNEFPDANKDVVEAHNDGTYVRLKHNTTWETSFGPHTRRLFAELASPSALLALERVSGISGLLPDPYMFGGGLHFTRAGGKLAMHADFNRHPKLNLDRRLNLLLYLNEGWTEANQGWLELWDREMRKCEARVLPLFNRTVLFSTTSFSFHGQPEPILGSSDLVRRSVALYYYTNGRPAEEITESDHSTLWRARPDEGY